MRKLLVNIGLITFFLGIVTTPGVTFAASYDVSASVPYPVPSQPAVVDTSLPGVTTNQDVVEIFGTCQNLAPISVVSVWRNGVLLGSVNCEANGTYRLNITLIEGENVLVVKTNNLSSIYGPDSSSFSLFYTPPTKSAASNSSGSISSPGTQVTSSSDLTISTPNTFEILNDSNSVTIQVGIDGGSSPYVVTLNWGDGTTDSMSVATPGTYTFKHTYSSKGTFKAVATVTDVLGVSKVHQFIITTATPLSYESNSVVDSTQNPSNGSGSRTQQYLILVGVAIVLMIITLIFLTSFWLGRKYEYSHLGVITKNPHKSPKKGFVKKK